MRLRLVRESMGLKQDEMAKELGVQRDTYAKWETRGSSMIPHHLIPEVCKLGGFDIWWFMTGKAPSTTPSRNVG